MGQAWTVTVKRWVADSNPTSATHETAIGVRFTRPPQHKPWLCCPETGCRPPVAEAQRHKGQVLGYVQTLSRGLSQQTLDLLLLQKPGAYEPFTRHIISILVFNIYLVIQVLHSHTVQQRCYIVQNVFYIWVLVKE